MLTMHGVDDVEPIDVVTQVLARERMAATSLGAVYLTRTYVSNELDVI